jgi:phosphatidylglycerol---prolipoprotein diacylglyceryl transferase
MLPFVQIGSVSFALYGLFVSCGSLTAYHVSRINARRYARPLGGVQGILTLLTIVVWGAICSKLYIVLDAPGHFLTHPADLLHRQGYTFYGAALGVMAISPLLARLNRMQTLELMDLLFPGVVLAYGIGRIGCFFAGDGDYGIPTELPWGMTFPHGLVPTSVAVHPTPLYEFGTSALIFVFLWSRGSRVRSPGDITAHGLLWTGLARFLVEFIRLNPPVLLGFRNAQLVALFSMTCGICLWYARASQKPASTS